MHIQFTIDLHVEENQFLFNAIVTSPRNQLHIAQGMANAIQAVVSLDNGNTPMPFTVKLDKDEY